MSLTSCPAIAAPKTRPVGPPSVPAIGPGAMPVWGIWVGKQAWPGRGPCPRAPSEPEHHSAHGPRQAGRPALEPSALRALWAAVVGRRRRSMGRRLSTRADADDAHAVLAAVLEAERAGERVDARLGGAGVGLEGQRLVVQRRRDVDHERRARRRRPPPRAGEGAERGTAHVVGALHVNVDDGAEGFGRELLGRAHEVAGGAVHKDVQATVLMQARGHRRCARVGVAHIAAACRRHARGPALAQRAATLLQDCNTATEEGQACPMSGKCLGDAQPNPRAAAGHQDHQATKAVFAEGRLGLRPAWLPRDEHRGDGARGPRQHCIV